MEIECSLCKALVEHTEIFYKEETEVWHKVLPELFVCLNCQEGRLKKLREAAPEEIYRLLRLCHPNEQGEFYSRYEVMKEFMRRPEQIFDALKWPRNIEAVGA